MVIFQYLFCIFNSGQGFLIFIFHNIREPGVQAAWISLIQCCQRRVKPREQSAKKEKSSVAQKHACKKVALEKTTPAHEQEHMLEALSSEEDSSDMSGDVCTADSIIQPEYNE